MKNLKRIIGVGLSMIIAITLNAQTTEAEETLKKQTADTLDGWKTGGVVSLNFSQVSLSNWTAGGQNSIALNGLVSVFANLKKGNSTWDNSLDIGYGLLQQGTADIIKSDDKIDFLSKYGQKAFKNWYYAGLVNFKTQFTAGYDYPNDSVEISNFLAPGYLLGAIGMDYKPNEHFTAFISPVTLKMTLVNDQTLADAGAFGVAPAEYDDLGQLVKAGETTRSEVGGYVRVLFQKDIMKNVNFKTKLDLFSNYSEEPQNVDVNWETLVAMKVNKYISATVTTHLIYDHDIMIGEDTNGDGNADVFGPRTQFKEVLGIGFLYKF